MKERVEAANISMQSWELELEDAIELINDLWAHIKKLENSYEQ